MSAAVFGFFGATRRDPVLGLMQGLGDSVYQRPFVAWWAERTPGLLVATPWPEVFEDLDVRFVHPVDAGLRTQSKNVARQGADRWVVAPPDANRVPVTYHLATPGLSIYAELRAAFGIPDTEAPPMDLPVGAAVSARDRYAVVRPVTRRRECLNTARSPDPAYVAQAVEALKEAGYRVVSVADADGTVEVIEGPGYQADEVYHGGEVSVGDLMALVAGAAVVVAGVGWILPMAVAAGTPAVVLGGGQGLFNAPERLVDSVVQADAPVAWLLPDNYCCCDSRLHSCPKAITDFSTRFAGALGRVVEA